MVLSLVLARRVDATADGALLRAPAGAVGVERGYRAFGSAQVAVAHVPRVNVVSRDNPRRVDAAADAAADGSLAVARACARGVDRGGCPRGCRHHGVERGDHECVPRRVGPACVGAAGGGAVVVARGWPLT